MIQLTTSSPPSFPQTLSHHELSLIIQLMDSLLQILESVSFVSVKALGIKSEQDLSDLVQLLTVVVGECGVLQGHHDIR